MSTLNEKTQAITHALWIAERKLKELNEKPLLTRAEIYEKDMTIDCIKRAKRFLGLD